MKQEVHDADDPAAKLGDQGVHRLGDIGEPLPTSARLRVRPTPWVRCARKKRCTRPKEDAIADGHRAEQA